MVQKHPYRTRHKEDFKAGQKDKIPAAALKALEEEAAQEAATSEKVKQKVVDKDKESK